MIEKVVIITRATRLEVLIQRFNTRDQARFWIERMGLSFDDYDREHETYHRSLTQVRRAMEQVAERVQVLDRELLPTFIFTASDLVVTVGQDGLVVNTAKYLDGQPIVAVNPDPSRWDGILLPFSPATAGEAAAKVIQGRARAHRITMAEARLNDGQRLLAFNDFLIGARTHVSARYSLRWREREERQSSSGVLVTTGAGSTGWFSSTQHMAAAVRRLLDPGAAAEPMLRLPWDDRRLAFVVREPFLSRWSGIDLAAGLLEPGEELVLESHMPDSGVIFSDGIEADALAFNSGVVARICASERHTHLVSAGTGAPLQASPAVPRPSSPPPQRRPPAPPPGQGQGGRKRPGAPVGVTAFPDTRRRRRD